MRHKNPMLTINHYQPIRYQSFYKILIKCPFIICLSYNWERNWINPRKRTSFLQLSATQSIAMKLNLFQLSKSQLCCVHRRQLKHEGCIQNKSWQFNLKIPYSWFEFCLYFLEYQQAGYWLKAFELFILSTHFITFGNWTKVAKKITISYSAVPSDHSK